MRHACLNALTTGIATGLLLLAGCGAKNPAGPEETFSLPGNWRGEGAGLQVELTLNQTMECPNAPGGTCFIPLLYGVVRFRLNPTEEWYAMEVNGYSGSDREVNFSVERWGASPTRLVAFGRFSGAFQSASVLAGTVSFSSDTLDPNFVEFTGRAFAITLTRS